MIKTALHIRRCTDAMPELRGVGILLTRSFRFHVGIGIEIIAEKVSLWSRASVEHGYWSTPIRVSTIRITTIQKERKGHNTKPKFECKLDAYMYSEQYVISCTTWAHTLLLMSTVCWQPTLGLQDCWDHRRRFYSHDSLRCIATVSSAYRHQTCSSLATQRPTPGQCASESCYSNIWEATNEAKTYWRYRSKAMSRIILHKLIIDRHFRVSEID